MHKIIAFSTMMMLPHLFSWTKLQVMGFACRNHGSKVLRGLQTRRFSSSPSSSSSSSSLSLSLTSSHLQVAEEKMKTMNGERRQDEFKEQMKDWRGTSRSTSEFVSHFIAGNKATIEEAIWSVMPQRRNDLDQKENISEESKERRKNLLDVAADTVISSLDMKFRHNPIHIPLDEHDLYPVDLLAMGAIWYLPADAPRDPALGLKPIRLGVSNLTSSMIEGDYLRIHHSPRRFPVVSDFDWGRDMSYSAQEGESPGLIVQENTEKGYIVLNKPAGVPVHPTVDNNVENVAGSIGRSLLKRKREEIETKIAMHELAPSTNRTIAYSKNAKKSKDDPLLYVVTPQRLDQNTSGLFVVATKKLFAAYYAELLRKKTDALLQTDIERDTSSVTSGRIRKKYRCLVCVTSKENAGYENEVQRLRTLTEDRSLVTHYLKKEQGAPRTFSSEYYDDWLECLMRITDVGDIIPLTDGQASTNLCTALWGDDEKPKDCTAIIQVEVELLTGRTHQIRGQMSTLGFPLCGDKMYGGALSSENNKDSLSTRDGYSDGYLNSHKLALQCCELSFFDPDEKESGKNGKVKYVSSNRLNSFRLDEAWWTDLVADVQF